MKKEINVFDYSETILKALSKGVLITTQSGDKVNSMTISWGTLGIEWGTPIFTTFVREGRFTRELLDKSMNFTVNIPLGAFDKKILGYCGTRSGRDISKIQALGLHTVPSDCVEAPGIQELPLTLECRVVHRQLQDRNALVEDKLVFYPQDVPSTRPDRNRDFHVAYSGEILKAYIIE